MIVHLGAESYIDTEEKEHLSWYLEDVKKYWRKCKRYKLEFNDEEAAKLIRWGTEELPEHKKEIINRVKELGDKATIDNIHDKFHDHMRKELYDDMVAAGWNEWTAYRWIYGWHRWAEAMNVAKYGDLTVQQTLKIEDDADFSHDKKGGNGNG